MMLPVTSLLALPLTLLLIGLAYRVAALRVRNRIGLGVGSNKTLARAMAAHGNAMENIPAALILMALAEIQSANPIFLSVLGIVFVIARVMNALGVSQHSGRSFGRFYGILLSWLVIIILAASNVWLNLAV